MNKLHPRWIESTHGQRLLAGIGLSQLNAERLEITLVPAPQPIHRNHKIRVAVNQNPQWYRDMASSRGTCGSLRIRVIKALKRVLAGWYDLQGLEGEALIQISNQHDKLVE